MQVVLEALDTGWRQKLRIRDLARKVDVSPTWLQRLFKAELGVTIQEYVSEKRLSFAAHLLSASEKPVKEIMFQSGFKDPSNFTRAFRKKFGLTPGEFRARVLNAEE